MLLMCNRCGKVETEPYDVGDACYCYEGVFENMEEQIIKDAKALCEKFITKVETGRARSRETYADCKDLLKLINKAKQEHVER